MTTERDDTMFVDECDRALDEMERALADVRLAPVEATIDERATTRKEDDAREFRARAAATSGAVVDARARSINQSPMVAKQKTAAAPPPTTRRSSRAFKQPVSGPRFFYFDTSSISS